MNRAALLSVVVAGALAAPGLGQTSCVNWETAIGTPGIPDGYVGAFGFYQGQVFAGGSFSGVAGVGNTDYVARWNPQTGTWAAVGGGINQGQTNAFGTSFANFDFGSGEELVYGGFFFNAANVSGTRSLARWNGTSWANLETGFGDLSIVEAVWDLLATDAVGGQSRLYAVGQFPAIGGQTCGGIAYYHGGTWHPMNTAITGTFSPGVFEAEVFNGELYVGGRFTTLDGQDTNLVAKWTGSGWVKLGGGITSGSAQSQVTAMCVFDDGNGPALYIGGQALRVGSTTNYSVVKWNGTALAAVGQPLGGTIWDLIVFDDGAGPKVYAGGTSASVARFARLEGNTWVPAFGSANNSVFAVTTHEGAAYVGGNFTTVGTGAQATGGLAILDRCNADCPADFDNDGFVTGVDFDLFVTAFEAGSMSADFDGDGFVSGVDFDLYVTAYEAGC